MLTVNDIALTIEAFAPTTLCSEGDNVGLLVGRRNSEITKILTALEVDTDIVAEAESVGANMIVCHHPLIYRPLLNAVTDDSHTGRLVISLIEKGIAVYAAHTNLDWAESGVCDQLSKLIGLENTTCLVDNEGRVGEITPVPLEKIIFMLKEQCPGLKYVGNHGRMIKKVGLVSGGGCDWLEDAYKKGCDLFISADFKYHQAQYAYENDICIIDAGHFETENSAANILAKIIKKKYNDIDVIVSTRSKSYYNYAY